MILIGLSGHGHFDMSAYQAFLAGELTDLEFSEEDMAAALEHLPEAPVLDVASRRIPLCLSERCPSGLRSAT